MDILKKIGKAALVAGFIAGSYIGTYYAGLNQRASFKEIPMRAQEVIKEEHCALESLLQEAIAEYKQENMQTAFEKYHLAESISKTIKKVDPNYNKIKSVLNQYRAYFIDTEWSINMVEGWREYVQRTYPEKAVKDLIDGNIIVLGKTADEVLSLSENGLLALDKRDPDMKKSMLRTYYKLAKEWYNTRDELRDKISQMPEKNKEAKWALKALEDTEFIKADREYLMMQITRVPR